MARLFVFGVLFASILFMISLQPADARSFTGAVLQVSTYSITVEHNPDDIKIFQIRAETQRPPDIGTQDIVKVHYRDENGILIATKIDMKRKTGQ